MRDERQLSESDITKHTWGFEWDDIEKAVKEVSEEQFGSDNDIPGSEQFCYECGEINEVDENGKNNFCPYCGSDYGEAKEARRFLASVIDIVYPLWTPEVRVEYHSIMKVLRSVSPEFRAMWEKEANKAALARRYS